MLSVFSITQLVGSDHPIYRHIILQLWLSCWGLYCCDKHQDQKQCREERVYLTLQPAVHHAGKTGQELRQRSWSADY